MSQEVDAESREKQRSQRAAPLVEPTVIGGAGVGVSACVPIQGEQSVTHMPGERRYPLRLDRAELCQRWTTVQAELLDEVVRQGAYLVPAAMDRNACELWGHAEQESFTKVLSEVLACADHASVRAAQRHLFRLRELLGDAASLFGEGSRSWFKRRGARARLDEIAGELEELKPLLSTAHASLQNVRETHLELSRDMCGLHLTVKALVLLAEVLLEQVALELQSAVLARGTSLAMTEQQLHQQRLTNAQAGTDLERLAHALHDALWVQWPLWQSTVAALPAGELSETQRYLVRDCVQTFLHRIH